MTGWLLAAPDDRAGTCRIFLRLLALIYLCAFASLAVQIDGLVGPEGILPYGELLEGAWRQEGWKALLLLPGVFWIDASGTVLTATAIAGALCSLAWLLGRFERAAAVLCFALYLSLFHAGQIFLSFQWDTLLLEAGFLAIFLTFGASRLLLLLFEWLLFRFRFMSGVAKLASGDPSWRDLSVLDHYFETQPLPHLGSWYAHHLPHWLHSFGTGFTLFTELVVPFLIFLPRPWRITAALITIFMQLLILATSNHAFVNLLVIVLCLLLLDDRFLRRWLRWLPARPVPVASGPLHGLLLSLSGLLIVVVSISAYVTFVGGPEPPRPLARTILVAQSWGLGNIYHIFPTMQTTRQELVIEGSSDGRNWQPYEFRYKPGDPMRRPAFVVPHHPRLDWLMWFVPTQDPRQQYWFNRFLARLRTGSQPVLGLLEHNPFPDRPPRFLRVTAWDYRFTTPAERARTGAWWVRHRLGRFPYVPPRRP
ncbi:MAG: lipase maturation factor family protein [Gammaproteobacteria bacterium]|nr:MAG: lipase maturation factor family protein [Gammaproteobacteria bacterium]